MKGGGGSILKNESVFLSDWDTMVGTMVRHTMLQWACIMCTLLMDFRTVYCMVCGTRQPRNRARLCRVITPETPELSAKKSKKIRKPKEKKKKRGRPRSKVMYTSIFEVYYYNKKKNMNVLCRIIYHMRTTYIPCT